MVVTELTINPNWPRRKPEGYKYIPGVETNTTLDAYDPEFFPKLEKIIKAHNHD